MLCFIRGVHSIFDRFYAKNSEQAILSHSGRMKFRSFELMNE